MTDFLVFLIISSVFCCGVSVFDFLVYRNAIKKFDVEHYQNRLHTLELDVARLRYERDCMRIELNEIKSYLIGPEYKVSYKVGDKSDC